MGELVAKKEILIIIFFFVFGVIAAMGIAVKTLLPSYNTELTNILSIKDRKKIPSTVYPSWKKVGFIIENGIYRVYVETKNPIIFVNSRFIIWTRFSNPYPVSSHPKKLFWFANFLIFVDCENMVTATMDGVPPGKSDSIMIAKDSRIIQKNIQKFRSNSQYIQSVEQNLQMTGRMSYIERGTLPFLVSRIWCR